MCEETQKCALCQDTEIVTTIYNIVKTTTHKKYDTVTVFITNNHVFTNSLDLYIESNDVCFERRLFSDIIIWSIVQTSIYFIWGSDGSDEGSFYETFMRSEYVDKGFKQTCTSYGTVPS